MTEQEPVASSWSEDVARRIGRRVVALRTSQRLSAQQLADRLAEHGHEIGRASLSQLENGRRGVSVPDLIALAWALDTSPLMLLIDPEDGDDFPYVPETAIKTIDFIDWWSGTEWPARSGLPIGDRPTAFSASVGPLEAWREWIAQDTRRVSLLGELSEAYALEWGEADRERGERLRRVLEDAVLDARYRAAEAATGVPWVGAEWADWAAPEETHLERIARVRREGEAETDGDG